MAAIVKLGALVLMASILMQGCEGMEIDILKHRVTVENRTDAPLLVAIVMPDNRMNREVAAGKSIAAEGYVTGPWSVKIVTPGTAYDDYIRTLRDVKSLIAQVRETGDKSALNDYLRAVPASRKIWSDLLNATVLGCTGTFGYQDHLDGAAVISGSEEHVAASCS